MWRLTVFAGVTMYLSVPCWAQDGYSLQVLVERALERSHEVASFKARVSEADFAAAQARAWDNPSLDLVLGRKRISPFGGPLVGMSVAQPLSLFGKRGRMHAILNLRAARVRVEQQKGERALAHTIVVLAYAHSVNHQKVEFADKRLRRFAVIREYLAGHLFASPQKTAESRIVENHLRNLTADHLTLQAAHEVSFEQLDRYIALEGEPDIHVEVPWLRGVRQLEPDMWIREAVAGNRDLQIQELSVEVARAQVSRARVEAWPDIAVSAFFQRETAGETERAIGGGLSIGLPLFNRNRRAIESSEMNARAEEHALRLKRRELVGAVKQLLVEYNMLRRIVADYPESLLGELHQQLADAERGFRQGRVDLLTLLELDAEVDETANRAFDAQHALIVNASTLMLLKGDDDVLSELTSF